ncbi:MAG: glycine--tRNA ligase subunit beta [Desulfovibrio sp.]
MSDFVLEIGTEEMPARFVPKLAKELKDFGSAALKEAKIEFDEVVTYATPRRLALLINGISTMQRAEEEVVSGPPVNIAYDADGNLTKAGEGFARTQGIDAADLYTITKGKGEYLAAKKTVGGGKTVELLPEICQELITKLTFPKKMRWGSMDYWFGRPINWLVALLDADVVSFEVAELQAGRETQGHRVLGRGPWTLEKAQDYVSVIEGKGAVVLSPERRKEVIIEEGDRQAAAVGGKVIWNDSLLELVSNLVEVPVPLLGNISESYLELPRQVLLTSMQKHQFSFGIEDADGNLMPHFLTTLNNKPTEVSLVQKGWERVLKARLEDGRFFWETDIAADMNAWCDKLENVIFLGPLGSMGDKTRRLETLCGAMAPKAGVDAEEMALAGRLAKADLVSEMVNEFDSLQGIMGGIYASRQGMSEVVSSALTEQYLPAGPDTPVPASLSGALLSIADKIDILTGCFGLNMIPTGAKDNNGLRRAALGICRIIIQHKLPFTVRELLAMGFEAYQNVEWKMPVEEALDKLDEFFAGRLRAYFTGQSYPTRVVDAALGAGFADIRALEARVAALADFSKRDDFETAVLTFKRAANIIRKQGGDSLTGTYDAALFEIDAEKALAETLAERAERFEQLIAADDYPGLLTVLFDLRPSVDQFFDDVMVMCDDEAVRANRLNLLKSLVDRLGRLADFNALQV